MENLWRKKCDKCHTEFVTVLYHYNDESYYLCSRCFRELNTLRDFAADQEEDKFFEGIK